MQKPTSDSFATETTSKMFRLIDQVASPESPYAEDRSRAMAKELIRDGLLERALKHPPKTPAELEDCIQRLAWWIDAPKREAEEKKRDRKRRRREKRPPV